MGWAAIISAIVSVLGPLLVEWLKKWLENRLVQASERLPAFASYGDEHAARDVLFDQAVADLPRWAFARRMLLRRAKAAAAKAGVTSAGAANPIPPEELADLADAAGAAAEE